MQLAARSLSCEALNLPFKLQRKFQWLGVGKEKGGGESLVLSGDFRLTGALPNFFSPAALLSWNLPFLAFVVYSVTMQTRINKWCRGRKYSNAGAVGTLVWKLLYCCSSRVSKLTLFWNRKSSYVLKIMTADTKALGAFSVLFLQLVLVETQDAEQNLAAIKMWGKKDWPTGLLWRRWRFSVEENQTCYLNPHPNFTLLITRYFTHSNVSHLYL